MQRNRSLFHNLILLLGLLSVLQAGCAPTYYVKVSSSKDISSIKRISIWQFPSQDSIQNSGNIVTKAFKQAFSEKGFILIDSNKFAHEVKLARGIRRGQALKAEIISPDIIKQIQSETGADALLLGEISPFTYCSPSVSYQRCHLECYFQLIDTRSGETIMYGRLMKESISLRDAALQLARRVVSRLKK